MKLNLKKPLLFFDIESTGLNPIKDRIVQLSYIKVLPDGEEETGNLFFNPEGHIPEASTEIHGITDEMVADKPTFRQMARKLEEIFKGCDLAGFNSNRFDVPMLMEEFLRAGVKFNLAKCKLVDVQNIYHKKERRTLIAAYKFYCDKDLTEAHSADADTRATYEVLKGQLDMYPDLQNDVAWLQDYSMMSRNVDPHGVMCYNDQDQVVFNIGKYKGRLVEEVFTTDPSYYAWMMNGQFGEATKQILTEIKFKMLK